ncbi:phytosulfokines 4-like [Lolium rigidum]|uniref:phytosulfokines 4-like n=1 Tax=Lolium rigidum TaxID=89674 RepID=UPI001F5DE290|nr:phytosulfokines 4-like [Lolium rigidum]
MARATTLALVAALAVLLILSSGPARAAAARTAPADVAAAATKASANEKVAEDRECETVAGEQQREDCLARRTLAAHTDYIYTQDNGHN